MLTKSTKSRLEELEATKEELETKIACEKLAKPKVSAEFMTFWLHRFRKLDVRQKFHRKMLIDTFVNAIFLYDDKMVITFNYKDGTDTVTFGDLKTALDKEKAGSDLDCSAAPPKPLKALRFQGFFLCLNACLTTIRPCRRGHFLSIARRYSLGMTILNDGSTSVQRERMDDALREPV